MSEITLFEPFPKLARLNRDCVITEKLDGTNAQVYINMEPLPNPEALAFRSEVSQDGVPFTRNMFAASRTRMITPKDDNQGFATWVQANSEELFKLGQGRHFGEWWGGKIQRGYGSREKHFSLFNTHRWADKVGTPDFPKVCEVVPVLYKGPFNTDMIAIIMDDLQHHGSYAFPFMNPEGIVVFHEAARVSFKVTFEGDAQGKERMAA